MRGCSDVVLKGDRECSCATFGSGEDGIHERCDDFTDSLVSSDGEGNSSCPVSCMPLVRELKLGSSNDGVDSDSVPHAFLLNSSNSQNLEEIAVADESGCLCPASCVDKLVIAFSLLLIIAIISFIVFVVLLNKGVIHVPGITSGMTSKVAEWGGIGLCLVVHVFFVGLAVRARLLSAAG